jgi:menaquinone-dependent protoporphyrinogen oxidase
MKVLIAYASWHGSTAGIAQRIAAVLRREGIEAEAHPIREAPGTAGYDAVVVGSAVHQQAWSAEAAEYVRAASDAGDGPALWLFSVGMSDGLPRRLRRPARTAQQRRIEADWGRQVRPREHRVFSGVCRPEQLPRWVGILFRALGGRFGDYRNWPAIDDWAGHIASELRAAGGAAAI